MKAIADSRYMMNKEQIDKALDGIAAAEVVSFSPMDALSSRRKYGITAESIEKAFPFAVETDGMGMKYVDYEALVPVLFKAIAELAGRRRQTKTTAQ